MSRLLSNGTYHILPSFFKFLIELCARKIDFRILFRTFGADSANVVSEFNTFCEGKHPLFGSEFVKNSDITNDLTKLKLAMPECSARILRTGPTAEEVHLAHITEEQVKSDLLFVISFSLKSSLLPF